MNTLPSRLPRQPRMTPDQASVRPITDLPPTFECAVGNLSSQAWVFHNPDEEVRSITLLAQGWNTTDKTLGPLADEYARQNPGVAAVIFRQPREPLPRSIRDFPAYLKAASGVAELRARTIEAVGLEACKLYGLDDTTDIIGHSLGGLDSVIMATRSDQLRVRRFTGLAVAGRLQDHQVRPTLWRALQVAVTDCDPQSLTDSRDKPRYSAIRNVLRPDMYQNAREAAYGLSQHLDEPLADMTERLGAETALMDFKKDRLLGDHIRSIPGFGRYWLMSEGLACHCAPSHASESWRIVSKLQDMWNSAVPVATT